MTMGSAWPGRVMVTVQPPGWLPDPPMPPAAVASYSHLGVGPGLYTEHPSGPRLGGDSELAGGLSWPGVPDGGVPPPLWQAEGTGGRAPPVYQGSCASWPYQL